MNIPVEKLRAVLRYCPETGALTWKTRDPSMFPNVGKGGADRNCAAWNSFHAGRRAIATKANNGYLKGELWGADLLAHRVAWALHYGAWPNGLIDHINGDKADNRIENLRLVDHSGNTKNNRISKKNTTGHIGVYWEPLRNKWRADITADKKTVCLGRFDNKDDAIAARKAAEPKYGFHPNHGRAA